MPIFFTKKSCNRGGGNTPPPQMPLTVKKAVGRIPQTMQLLSVSHIILIQRKNNIRTL